jgi:photosystem II stability/assembly factor-like uncharacterized protein
MRFSRGISALISILIVALGAGACGGAGGTTATPTVDSISPPVSLTPVSPPVSTTPVAPVYVPAGVWFSPVLTFVSAERGWLGQGSSEGGRILVTDDGGSTWTTQYTGAVFPQVLAFGDEAHGLAAGCVKPEALEVACQSKLLETSDGGAQWREMTTFPGGSIVAIAFVSSRDAWALVNPCACATGVARVYATNDGGESWSELVLPESSGPLAVQRVDAEHGWVLTQGDVLTTRDGGASWDVVTDPCRAAVAAESGARAGPLDFIDTSIGWLGCTWGPAAGTTRKVLYETTDGGLAWDAVSATVLDPKTTPEAEGRLPEIGGLTGLSFLDATHGWMALDGPAGFVSRTSDRGRTWDAVGSYSGGGIAHVTFVDRSDGWAWGDRMLWRTTDGGAHWEMLATPP